MPSLVTVFGGSGFLGRYAVRALARRGYRIRVAVRHPNLAHFLPPMGAVGQIQLVKADVTDSDTVAAALKGASAVVNLVGILYESGHQRFAALHAEAAGTIAKSAKTAGASTFVHISAVGVDENSEAIYARTKALGEANVCNAFADATILRPSLVFGPEDNFFNRFAALARIPPYILPALPLIGGGKTKFQPVYVADVASAIEKCVADSSTRGKTCELGGPGIYTFRELMEMILRETGRRRLLMPVPFSVAMLQASLLQMLPNPMLTRDQVRLLKEDNVVGPSALTFSDLGIAPDSLEGILPTYLWRFRREGQYEVKTIRRADASP